MYEEMKQVECQYQDIVVEVLAVAIQMEVGFQEQMQGRMGRMEWEEVTRYWGQRVRWGGTEVYRMMMEVWEVMQLK